MTDYGLDRVFPYSGARDLTLPYADDDDGLLAPGALALFDAAHSVNPLTSVPALNADIPNLAWKHAQTILGSALFTGRIDNGTPGVSGDTLTVTALAAGKIIAGQTITGSGVTTTFITGQLTGADGGVGTYQVKTAQAAASTTITAAAQTQTTLSLTRSGQADKAGVQITEMSGKGGLHVIQTQTNGESNRGVIIDAKTPIFNYVSGNIGHSYYVSLWDRVTRQATAAADPGEAFIGFNLGGYLTMFQPGSLLPSGSARIGSFSDPSSRNVTGANRFGAIGAAGYTGSFSSLLRLSLFGSGTWGPWQTSPSYFNKAASRVVYRAYLEDLTVSGRTYEQVRVADYTMWKAAHAVGGRYYGDTFTTPAI